MFGFGFDVRCALRARAPDASRSSGPLTVTRCTAELVLAARWHALTSDQAAERANHSERLGTLGQLCERRRASERPRGRPRLTGVVSLVSAIA